MIVLLAELQRWMRAWSRDWPFWIFVVASSAAVGYAHWARQRSERVFSELSTCLATRDTACASNAVARASALRPEDPRVRIGRAGVDVLLHELPQASLELTQLEAMTDLPAAARGELLLVRGDWFAAFNEPGQARERYEAARASVPEALWRPRIASLDARRDTESQEQAGDRRELRKIFDKLLAAAEASDSAAFGLRATDIQDRIGGLPHAPRKQFELALDAARASMRGGSSKSYRSPFTPAEPVKPAPPIGRSSWAQESYQRQLTEYERQAKSYRDQNRRRDEEDAKARQSAAKVLKDARDYVDEGFAAMKPGDKLGLPRPVRLYGDE